jgi:hypothetical protein
MALVADGQRRKTKRCYSNPSCVWVGMTGDVVELSETVDGETVLRFESRRWTEFIAGIKAGDFD